MANYWTTDGTEWVRKLITGDVLDLSPSSQRNGSSPARISDRMGESMIKKFTHSDSSPFWAMLCSADSRSRVNGKPVSCGLHILRDRDEILCGGNSLFYFSLEELAIVEAFPAQAHAVFCSRCRQSIEEGSPAVCCPSCGHWCEQSETKPCWTYGPTCPLCEQPTAFDAGLRWTPEEL